MLNYGHGIVELWSEILQFLALKFLLSWGEFGLKNKDISCHASMSTCSL